MLTLTRRLTPFLLAGLLRGRAGRDFAVPFLSLAALGAFAGLTIWQFHAHKSIISGALRADSRT